MHGGETRWAEKGEGMTEKMWTVDGVDDEIIVNENGSLIAEVLADDDQERVARLISKAPEMYEELVLNPTARGMEIVGFIDNQAPAIPKEVGEMITIVQLCSGRMMTSDERKRLEELSEELSRVV